MAVHLCPSQTAHPRGKGKLAELIQELADKYKMPFEDVVRAANDVLEGQSKPSNAGGVCRVS